MPVGVQPPEREVDRPLVNLSGIINNIGKTGNVKTHASSRHTASRPNTDQFATRRQLVRPKITPIIPHHSLRLLSAGFSYLAAKRGKHHKKNGAIQIKDKGYTIIFRIPFFLYIRVI
jgi:hypothetical protein